MDALRFLNAQERACLERYFTILSQHLGPSLVEVWLFGSAARGDMWPDSSPMHSDIDLLIITNERPSQDLCAALIDETYPLFLECGRQISPSVTTVGEFRAPPTERLREAFERVREEGTLVYRPGQAGGG